MTIPDVFEKLPIEFDHRFVEHLDGGGGLREDLRAYLRSHPRCIDGWLMLGDIYGSDEEQLASYRTALALDPTNPEAIMEVAQRNPSILSDPKKIRSSIERFLDHCAGYRDEYVLLYDAMRLARDHGLSDLMKRIVERGNVAFPEDNWDEELSPESG